MQIRPLSIFLLALAGALATAAGLGLLNVLDQREDVDSLLAEGVVASIVQFGGTVLALATTLLVIFIERRHREVELAAEICDAHRRVADEVRDLMRSASALLADPMARTLSLLPDDVWRTARMLLTTAHREANDPLDYALTDFYTRVRFLQLADRMRLEQVLAGASRHDVDELVRRDALSLAPLGEHLLVLLAAAQDQVSQSARVASA